MTAALPAGESVELAVARLAGEPLVEIVEPDYVGRGAGVVIEPAAGPRAAAAEAAQYVPNDPLFFSQWHLDQGSDADIDMPEAWDLRRSTLTTVAVLDTGVNPAHADLSGVVLPGYDFANGDDDPVDDQGHGTHVTGLMAAVGGNGIGVAGAAFDVRVIPVKVLDSQNFGFYSWWTQGFVYATDLGAPVINLSAGGENSSAALLNGVQYAYDRGIVICVAMMNENSSQPYYPAAYQETIAVGATNFTDERAAPFIWGGGSSYGSHIDLVAPGDNVISTVRGGGYGNGAGTSQATPLLSAVVALMIGSDGSIDPEEARRILRLTADDQVGRATEDSIGFDIYHGAVGLNAAAALAEVVSTQPPGPRLTALAARPNPSIGLVRLAFNLPQAGSVTVRVYDARGRLVRTLMNGVAYPAGQQVATWDGRAGDGRLVPTGVYLYEILSGGRRATGKLIRIK
jgi:subtilisin family serine protease